jgi:phosphotransferase system enzyme I (PtsI)
MRILKGIAASGGIAIGPAFVYHPRQLALDRKAIAASEVPAEIRRWEAARRQAIDDLARIQTDAIGAVGPANAAIFESQAMMLEDPALLEMVEDKIRQARLSAWEAIRSARAPPTSATWRGASPACCWEWKI